ncbi:hypothetical protein GGU10DRAFT_230905, partial [Lentinula aff. detonsa]
WFQDAFKFLNVDLGSPYNALVAQWITWERLNSWKNKPTGFKKFSHPQELTTWVNYGRYEKKPILIAPGNVEQFAESVWTWWLQLQPRWRQTGEDNRLLTVDDFKDDFHSDDWKSLNFPGANRWLGLLACLRWWGEGLAWIEDKSVRNKGAESWLHAIGDMSKMLEGLILYK